MQQPIAANEIDLSHFNPVFANYGPKSVYAPAALVTEDNIGKFSLEFEVDLQYVGISGTGGTPFFKFLATRELEDPIELSVFPGFWIILLWNEIHIFRDDLFRKTFEIDDPNMEKLQEYAEADVKMTEQILTTSQEITKIMPSVGEMVETISASLPADGSEKYEKFIEKATGKKVQFREGVYDQLSESAKTAFERFEDKRPQGATPSMKPEEIERAISAPIEDVWGEGTEKPEIPQGNLDIDHS